MTARLEPTSDMPVTFKNWRLVNSDMSLLLATTLWNRKPESKPQKARSPSLSP
jgi:hypothetical protein